MERNTISRGFLTIATGDQRYYALAQRLLHSYRAHSTEKIPFAILCDCENACTAQFDYAIVMDTAAHSYLDKLQMYRYSPFDETIFIDADSLVLKDPAKLWEDFGAEDDVSCYGAVFPLESDRAWFTYEGSGKWKQDIHYLVGLHGGIYYFRKTERCAQIFERAIELANTYDQYSFKDFRKPADEPVMAMAMAIHGCHPCEKPARLVFVHAHQGKIRTNRNGELLLDGKKLPADICHFATRNTTGFLYCYLAALCEADYGARMGQPGKRPSWIGIRLKTLPHECITATRYRLKRIAKRCLPEETVRNLKETLEKLR